MIEQIFNKIKEYEKIIIHRHESPDPDAIGSQAGLAAIVKGSYPNKKVYIVGEEVEDLTFLSKMDEITDEEYEGALVIVTDTANTERISDKRYNKGEFIIKIDHHPNEDPYGDLLWVDTNASSASEMIYSFYEKFKEELVINDEAALLLYAGIVGDTGRFRYPNTTPVTHRYVSELIQNNIDQNEFYSNLYKRDLRVTRLEGYVLQNFEMLDGGLGVMNLTRGLLEEYKVTAGESSALVNSFSGVEGLLAWVYFVEDDEKDGVIRVRLRSKGPHINTIAAKYNGGGHPLASGAKLATWDETKNMIKDLQEVCKNFKK